MKKGWLMPRPLCHFVTSPHPVGSHPQTPFLKLLGVLGRGSGKNLSSERFATIKSKSIRKSAVYVTCLYFNDDAGDVVLTAVFDGFIHKTFGRI